MTFTLAPASAGPVRSRRLTLVVVGAVAAVGIAVALIIVLRAVLVSMIEPYAPSIGDGLIRGDEVVTIADEHVPAIAGLTPELRDAVRRATTDAASDGIAIRITSGWRSDAYQRWLMADAIRHYGSEEQARQYVATPENSRHVTGEAVDVGDVDAQFWLIERGAAYGLCQTYANERWHFELATSPGGVCPEMKSGAAA